MKRATEYVLRLKHSLIISIHALVKRATINLVSMYNTMLISIHALVKRATFATLLKLPDVKDFNPRPREEGDTHSIKEFWKNLLFQSTPS